MEIKKIGDGILVNYEGKRYAIDKIPKRVSADYHLVSHAHIDHLPNIRNTRVVASEETIALAEARGYKYTKKKDEEIKDIECIDSGHILGSKAFLIDGKILYTGDINIQNRLFLNGFNPPQAEILLIEATYGDKKYVFGEFHFLIDKLFYKISKILLTGRNIFIQAYPLGKTQLITEILDWYSKTYISPYVYKFNKIYYKYGKLKKIGKMWCKSPEEPFILIGGNGEYKLVEKYKPVSIRLSGWVILNQAKGIPISDHADFYDLIRTVDKVSPRKIYTVYGFANKFAEHLKKYGYDAEPLK